MTGDELRVECIKAENNMDMTGTTYPEKLNILMALCKRHQAIGLRDAADLVPTNWLDSLMSGPDSPFISTKVTGPQLETLLLKVKSRIEATAQEREV